MGLDDCLLRADTVDVARNIIQQQVQRLRHPGPAAAAVAGRRRLPYDLEEQEQVVGPLIAVRAESEGYIVDQAVRPSRRHHGGTDMTQANQIAVLCMLGTKGSVSNLSRARR